MIASELHAVRQPMEFSPTWILNTVVQRRLNWTELNWTQCWNEYKEKDKKHHYHNVQ